MVSEVVVKQGQEQQGQEQQGSAEDAAQGAGGRQKSQAQVEKEARRRWWQEERRRVRRAKRAAGEAERRAKEMELGAQRHGGAGVLPLPRAEAGAAKAKAQVKEAEAAKREAELKAHEAAEAQRRYEEAAQAENDRGKRRELQHAAGLAKHHGMCAWREKSNAEARLEVAKEDKVEADKALAAQRKRAARAGVAAAGQEAAADTGGQGAVQVAARWHAMVGVMQHKVAKALKICNIWALRQAARAGAAAAGQEAADAARNCQGGRKQGTGMGTSGLSGI